MSKYLFASFANHMLLGAVNAVRQDLQPGKKMDEPAYTAKETPRNTGTTRPCVS